MRKINLPVYGIRITIDKNGLGSISSNLHGDDEDFESSEFDAAINALESMILACACSGVDIEAPAFLEAIETALEAIQNNLD